MIHIYFKLYHFSIKYCIKLNLILFKENIEKRIIFKNIIHIYSFDDYNIKKTTNYDKRIYKIVKIRYINDNT